MADRNLFVVWLHVSIHQWLSENTPSIWAKASVHLIYKGNDFDIFAPESYCPISLTSNVSKVFERALFNRMQPEADQTMYCQKNRQVFARADHAGIRSTF
jgi:hypothetical protein